MSLVLVDSSVWIHYFRGTGKIDLELLDELIDSNRICTNDLILSELIPPLMKNRQKELIDILRTVRNISLNIRWDQIIDFQYTNIKNGINNVGIPDLIIMQNALDNELSLFTNDRHFHIMCKLHKLKVI